MQIAVQVFAAVGALLAIAGAAYYALCAWAGLHFLRQRESASFAPAPPVSIMKSLKGVDPHMRVAFRSHCLIDYPEYEVLFGVNELSDPAVALVNEVQREFPNAKLRLIHCPAVLGANGKVSNLAQMLPQALYEHVLINDSDILVEPDFLRRVMGGFLKGHGFSRAADVPHLAVSERTSVRQESLPEAVGLVTTLYRAVAGRSVWSRLEALGISTDFMGGVLVAREMEGGIKFALGATMATTKSVLAKIGGLGSLIDVLGDDYELGARVAGAGYRVELADAVVETAIADYAWRDFWQHQLRWARNIKDRRFAQYFGLIVTFGLAWGILAVLLAHGAWWSWAALGVALTARLLAAVVVGGKVLRDPQVGRDLWLIPLRDFVALAVWVVSFFGNTVVWRGERFRLRDGKLEPR
jgi:ceramide glucosyltransferase